MSLKETPEERELRNTGGRFAKGNGSAVKKNLVLEMHPVQLTQ
jgi:hypothetical protein